MRGHVTSAGASHGKTGTAKRPPTHDLNKLPTHGMILEPLYF